MDVILKFKYITIQFYKPITYYFLTANNITFVMYIFNYWK